MSTSESRRAFAAAIDSVRRARHLSIREVARIADAPTPTVQGWLSGRHFPVPALRQNYLRIVEELGLGDRMPADLWAAPCADPRPRPRTGRPPYLGLRPFDTGDRDLFFGREAESRRLATAVAGLRESAGHGLLVLLGASGSGKSSLLAAGLIGGQAADGLLAGWTVARLAAADLGQTSAGPADLVVIDQFEEVFALEDAARAAAIATVSGLAETSVVLLALRADAFQAACAETALVEALSRPFLISPVTRAEAEDVIVGPARLAGLRVDEDLVAAMLDDVAPGPRTAAVATDMLPLLSTALLATWAEGWGDALTLSDYVRTGGVASAVQGLAEEVFASLDEAERAAAHRLFVRLVLVTGDLLIREPVSLDDIDAAGLQAMNAFVSARMLTVSGDTVRISHDSLLSHWSRLRDWITESRVDLEEIGRLRRAALVWIDSGRSPDALIPVDRLEVFSHWIGDPRRQALLSPREQEFLAVSRAHFTSVLAAEQQVSRRLRRGRRVAVGLTSLACSLALAAGLLYWQGRGLQAQADASRLDAQSRQVALEASSIRSDDPNLMAQMSLTAASLSSTRQAASALLDATSVNVPLRWLGAANAVVAVSPDESMVARANGSGQVTLWHAEELTTSPGRTFTVDPSGGPLYAVALAVVGGRTLLAVGGGAASGLWDVTAEPTLVHDLRDGDFTTYGVAFSATGDQLAVATSAGTVELWSVNGGTAPARAATLSIGTATPARSVAFSPASAELFVAGPVNAVARWSLGASPHRLADLPFTYGKAAVASLTVEVSPRGDQLTAGIAGQRVIRWQLDGARATRLDPLLGFGSWTNDLAYSRDGRTLLVANSDQHTYVFDAVTGGLREKLGGSSLVTGVVMVGDRPVSSGTDGAVRVWQAANPVLRTGSTAFVLAGDSAGRFLAGSTLRDGVELWDVSGASAVRLADPDAGGNSLSSGVGMAPDGAFLVGGTTDGKVLSWPLGEAGAGRRSEVTAFDGSYVSYTTVSPDSSTVAVVQYNGTKVALYRAAGTGSLTPVSTIQTSNPQAAAFSPDGSLLAVPIDSAKVELWDVRSPSSPTLAGRIEGLGSLPTYASFANHSGLLAVGTDAGQVSVWDVTDPASPQRRLMFGDPHAAVYATTFSPDDTTLVAGGGDDLVWAWHLDRPGTEAYLALDGQLGRVNDLRFLRDGRTLVAAGDNGTIRTWVSGLAEAHQRLCGNRGDVLSADERSRYLPGIAVQDPC